MQKKSITGIKNRAGAVVIISYNLIGSFIRGLGDSITPLITVLIACICNIIGDLILFAVLMFYSAFAGIIKRGRVNGDVNVPVDPLPCDLKLL